MTLTYRQILRSLQQAKTAPYRSDPEANEAILDEVVNAVEAALKKMAAAEDAEAKDAEIARLRQGLSDVVDTFGYLKRQADAEGSTLNGMALEISNNVGVIRDIARAALNPSP